MTDLDLDALKAAAKKANNGQPWLSRADLDSLLAEDIAQTDDVRFIALANPAAVLALIERLERAELRNRIDSIQKERIKKLDAVAKAAKNYVEARSAQQRRWAGDAGALELNDGVRTLQLAREHLESALAALEAP